MTRKVYDMDERSNRLCGDVPHMEYRMLPSGKKSWVVCFYKEV